MHLCFFFSVEPLLEEFAEGIMNPIRFSTVIVPSEILSNYSFTESSK
ncbi:hypothetical protein BDK61_3645 [Haloarcula quadrata]|uniref:Uncharacterized protein n=1 Tax=Haloarcula quadrata TaxID=182779 RepID=A0A495QV17_9EURY|nr:hypothetical protein BDK61_3645 [Haloarcula quadrata]